MIEKFKQRANRQLESNFDPASLNDEIAMITKWTPEKAGGSGICTHELKTISSGRVEFKIKGAAFFCSSLFMAAGIVAAVRMTTIGLEKNDMVMLYVGIPIGIIFFLAGFFVLRSFMIPRVFDHDKGYYWKGRKVLNINSKKNEQCQLEDIHAIQILRECCRCDRQSFYSYELNLVLKDGSRMNVIDHGKLEIIRKDTQKLAEFLNVPVWDATS